MAVVHEVERCAKCGFVLLKGDWAWTPARPWSHTVKLCLGCWEARYERWRSVGFLPTCPTCGSRVLTRGACPFCHVDVPTAS